VPQQRAGVKQQVRDRLREIIHPSHFANSRRPAEREPDADEQRGEDEAVEAGIVQTIPRSADIKPAERALTA